VDYLQINDVSDFEAANRIRSDAIDILIDLKGYTQDSRQGINAYRPASVIVNWLGFPCTMGNQSLADYLIGDNVVTPKDDSIYFSERLALMPDCYQPNTATTTARGLSSREAAGLPDTAIVLCNFNQSYKLTKDVFLTWLDVLRTVPEAVLWMLDPGAVAQMNLRRELASGAIAQERLLFASRVARDEHLARIALADLALDTFPCNSHTTASDALKAGIPLVTRIGSTFPSRVAASLLTTLRMEELIVSSNSEYRDLVVSIASDRQVLAKTKERLNFALESSPLLDIKRFAVNFERLLRRIWIDAQLPAESRPMVVELHG
jgi:predicted O-linked N-acetylglucosamine transferase (SPINDLY family)